MSAVPQQEQDAEDLLTVLKRQESNSVGYNSDNMSAEQIEGFERYIGEPYGDEQTGRSQVTTREVFETIEWLRPDISRMFGAAGKAVEIEPWAEGTEKQAEDATDFLNQVFFEQQDGHAIVDSLYFDGAVQKLGVVGVFWQEAEMAEPEEYEGLNLQQAQTLDAHPNYDTLESEPSEGFDPANPAPGPFRMKVQKVKLSARPYAKNIAPEDFRISPGAVDLDNVPYCGHIDRTTKSELKLLFPDKEAEIEEYANGSRMGVQQDERRQVRFSDEDGDTGSFPNSEEDDDVILHTEYLYYDLDKDGYDELIEVKRLDGCVLASEPVEENPYAAWSPIRIPHKLIGLSIADITKDIQRTQTVLLRASLDAAYQSVAPRIIANEKQVHLADLLTVRPGGVIRVKDGADVRAAVTPLVVPDVAGSALQLMERMDQAAEVRSGITRHAQGIDPDSLNKTATGIQLMQNAASIRKEMVARNFASGLELMFKKFYRLLVRQSRKGIEDSTAAGKQAPAHPKIRVGRLWVTFTPSTWDEEAKVRVHVGQGTGDRQTQVGQLTMILNEQKAVIANYGVGNPFVTPDKPYNTICDMGRVMGFRSMDRYFVDPSTIDPQKLQQLMAAKPSPDMMKIQAQQQSDQAKLQQQAQTDQQNLQLTAANHQQDYALRQQELQQKYALQTQQMQAEIALKERLEMAKISAGVYHPAMAAGIPDDVHIGGQPG